MSSSHFFKTGAFRRSIFSESSEKSDTRPHSQPQHSYPPRKTCAKHVQHQHLPNKSKSLRECEDLNLNNSNNKNNNNNDSTSNNSTANTTITIVPSSGEKENNENMSQNFSEPFLSLISNEKEILSVILSFLDPSFLYKNFIYVSKRMKTLIFQDTSFCPVLVIDRLRYPERNFMVPPHVSRIHFKHSLWKEDLQILKQNASNLRTIKIKHISASFLELLSEMVTQFPNLQELSIGYEACTKQSKMFAMFSSAYKLKLSPQLLDTKSQRKKKEFQVRLESMWNVIDMSLDLSLISTKKNQSNLIKSMFELESFPNFLTIKTLKIRAFELDVSELINFRFVTKLVIKGSGEGHPTIHSFQYLVQLKSLTLTSINHVAGDAKQDFFRSIPAKIWNLKIKDSNLRFFPEISHLSFELKHLIIKRTRIKQEILPRWLEGFEKLETLDLLQTNIPLWTDISHPVRFSFLPSLKKLHGFSLSSSLSPIFLSTSLLDLNLSHSLFVSISDFSLQKLGNLQKLNLSFLFRLSKPPEIGSLFSLNELIASSNPKGNHLKMINNLTENITIGDVYPVWMNESLRHSEKNFSCKIFYPPKDIEHCPALQTIDLSYSGIEVIPEKISSSSLKTMILSHNSIEVLPKDFYSSFPSLEVLDLSYNRIHSIHHKLFKKEMKKLYFLDLRNNPIVLDSIIFDSSMFSNFTHAQIGNNIAQMFLDYYRDEKSGYISEMNICYVVKRLAFQYLISLERFVAIGCWIYFQKTESVSFHNDMNEESIYSVFLAISPHSISNYRVLKEEKLKSSSTHHHRMSPKKWIPIDLQISMNKTIQ